MTNGEKKGHKIAQSAGPTLGIHSNIKDIEYHQESKELCRKLHGIPVKSDDSAESET